MNTKPRNIWMLNHYAGNLELGMEYRHFFLARHLRAMGHDVNIVSATFHHLYTKLPEVDGPLTFKEVDGVPFCWLKTPHYNGNGVRRLVNTLWYTMQLARQRKRIEQRFGKPDIILGSSPHPFVVWNLLHLKRAYQAPVVFEVRDLWPQMLIELGSISPRHPLCKLFAWIERQGFRNCDRVISLWKNADQYMFQHGLDPERYIYLPNGIEMPADGQDPEMDLDCPLVQQLRARKRAGKLIVGYGGSHGYANPLPSIVNAAKILRETGRDDIEFFLVGDGPCKADMVREARELGLNNIHFHDYVQKPEILAFYGEIDVAFMGLRDLPLFKYGPTPNKLMDYFLMAKPIIYAIRSDYNPVAEADAGVSIEPDDAEQLVGAIVELQSMSPESRQQLGRNGRRYAESELNFQSLASKLSDVVADCLGDVPRTSAEKLAA